MAGRRRLDAELVRRGLAPGRDAARRLVEEGAVLVNGAPAAKAASRVHPGDAIVVAAEPPRYVGRGGEKLEAALDALSVDVGGLRCIDVGSSTGGFTDCLLQHGARHVVAVDVGTAQLHEKLRADPRVESLERTDVRDLDSVEVGGPAPVVVCDVSFISLRSVMASLVRLLAPDGSLVVLVKPQFEVGRVAVSRGRGVVTDPDLWSEAVTGVVTSAREHGLEVHGALRSPITGGSGNVEFLLLLRRGDPLAPVDITGLCRSDAIR